MRWWTAARYLSKFFWVLLSNGRQVLRWCDICAIKQIPSHYTQVPLQTHLRVCEWFHGKKNIFELLFNFNNWILPIKKLQWLFNENKRTHVQLIILPSKSIFFFPLISQLQFRRQVADVLKPEHDDYYLLRWLRGKSDIRNAQSVP